MAFPECQDLPSLAMKQLSHFGVPCFVVCQFSFPKRALCPRLAVLAASMLVPEASVDEDYPLSGTENKIGIAGQITDMQAVTITHAMHQATHNHFRLGISVPDK